MSEDQKKRLTIDDNPSGVRGIITIDENVVSTIAGLAAREVDGIHMVGKSRLVQFGDDPTRGVHAEVGERQAAFDLDVIIEYGKDIKKVAQELRQKTAREVQRMAGREVVEININVVDIKLPGEETPKGSRVR
ncbi:MAG: Asp23/Gls24 family envelope stress response protein [Proteobacteria bacterium]|nr:Asp23/Gls24 family envelope stress response protein [Pseudomonadota bacterium]